jgi:cation diffusion facilitator CzcD-associated flavoprotein CzcO
VAESNLTSYSNWKWPQLYGLHGFKGDLIHSANWPKNFEYSGKKLAVIGNGSSGVQIVPALQPGKISEYLLGIMTKLNINVI